MSIRTQASPTVGFTLISKASTLLKKASQALSAKAPAQKKTREGFLSQYEKMLSEVVRLTIPKDF